MGVDEVAKAPASPWQNAYVERIIGTLRRELFDHVIVLNERHLKRLRIAEIIKYPKIAQDFGSDSRCGKGRIVVLCNLFHNAEKSVWNRFSR
ncbi:MAG: transposase [Gammaproteobacteria bacterium]|nr:transposase [Gammaproteobacteria bacterium]